MQQFLAAVRAREEACATPRSRSISLSSDDEGHCPYGNGCYSESGGVPSSISGGGITSSSISSGQLYSLSTDASSSSNCPFSELSLISQQQQESPQQEQKQKQKKVPTSVCFSVHYNSGASEQFSYCCGTTQGWGPTMEDSHAARMLPNGGAYFGVFDGHGGASVANFCGSSMYDFIVNTKAYTEKRDVTRALRDGFSHVDQHIYTHCCNYGKESGTSSPIMRCGSTAAVLFIRRGVLYCANAGDSRCVLCRDGEAVGLSYDHKAVAPHERQRVERAGGYIRCGLLYGALAASRGIGDFLYKGSPYGSHEEDVVTCVPEVVSVAIDRERDEFALLASEGIWAAMTRRQVVAFVRARLVRGMPLRAVIKELVQECLVLKAQSPSNMTVIIVVFRKKKNGDRK